MAGNETKLNLTYKIVLKIINGDLVKISPSSEGKLIIEGTMFAAKPGANLSFEGGFFNTKDITASEDGSFSVAMDYFTAVTIKGRDPESGRSDSVYIRYNVDTTLSGVVKDSDGNPLRGAIVSIVESGQSSVTDGTGTFVISNPATGDKTILVDGTTVPVEVSGANRLFFKTNIAVSIGTTQLNVIEDPIYLAPLIYDGTETKIEEGSGAVVSSPHAPGVELAISANSAIFPDGTKSGHINVSEISGKRTSVPVPEYAVPETVYAFEPSGLKFNEPAKLTVPNVNEFPEGIQLVVLSKNSSKGIWEIDGLARVDEGGQTITTEEGGGITHFSEIFVAPLGPTFQKLSGNEKSGADTFNGASGSSITLPSYKSLGKDIAPGLIYKSSWANPNAVVSSVFDVPRQEFQFHQVLSKKRNLLGKGSAAIYGTGWVEPKWIKAQFFSNNIASEEMNFEGGVPNKAVVSYAMDLSSQESGVQPYQSRYKMRLNQLIVGTVETRTKKLFGSTKVRRDAYDETREIEEVFPSDVSGSIIIQNKKNSSVGTGWKLNLGSKIHFKGGGRALLENADGSTTLYTLSNKIETIYKNEAGEFYSANFDNPNNILIVDNRNSFKQFDPSTDLISQISIIPQISGHYGFSVQDRYPNCSYCIRNFTRDRKVEQMVKTTSGEVFFTDYYGHLFKYSNGIHHVAGAFDGIPTSTFSEGNFCSSKPGINCGGRQTVSGWNCWYNPGSSGSTQRHGFVNGALAGSEFNSPKGIIAGTESSSLFVADYGNNRIRKIDLLSNIVSNFAGNGKTYDSGDGGMAINASIFHPQGLVYDKAGNLYVSTENGFIRKIAPNGRIERFAGKPVSQGGVFADQAPALEMSFNAPYGMVFDNDNEILYVADMGNHRIVAIDTITMMATTVAGSGQCVAGSHNAGDGKSALQASLCHPKDVGLDDVGNLLVFDSGHKSIRRISLGATRGQKLAFVPESKNGSILNRSSDGSFEIKYRNGAVDKFNSVGLLYESSDRVNNIVSYEYDENERLTKVTDPVNSEIHYYYSGDKLSSIVDPAGRETSFHYEGNFLTEVVFPDGTKKIFEYNDLGLMTSETNERLATTRYIYNEWQRLWKVVRPDNSEITIQDKGSATVGNNYTGGASGTLKKLGEDAYDGVKDPKGIEVRFDSDINGYVTEITDGNGRVTSMERDVEGRVTKIKRAQGDEVLFEYNTETNDLISKTENGLTVNFSYDQYGNLLRKDNSLGQWTQNTYDSGSGLLLSSTNHIGQTSSATYNEYGLPVSKINPLGATTTYTYDSFMNVQSVVDPMLMSTHYTRDAAGNIVSITNANGQVTGRGYDLFNRLTSVTDARGNTTQYQYLGTGDLNKIIDPLGNITAFNYDILGRMVQKINPLGGQTRLSYDVNGNVTQEIDPNGNVKSFEYNNEDKLVKKTLPDNIYEFEYDSYGNISTLKSSNSSIDYQYTKIGDEFRISSESWSGLGGLSNFPDNIIERSYDSMGNLTSSATNVGTYQYSYDEGNRLDGVLNPFGEEFQFEYDLANRLKKLARPGSTTSYNFDASNFLTEIRHTDTANNVLKKFEYARDNIGNRTAMRSPAGENLFNYDDDQQLVSSNGVDVGTETYSYDALGNRIQDQGGAYQYDEKKQRLIADYSYTYAYDANGNLTNKIKHGLQESENYYYNSENRLVRIEWIKDGEKRKEASYSYDVLGRRVSKVVNDIANAKEKSERYLYDGNEMIAKLNAENEVLAIYTPSTLRTDDQLSVHVTEKGVEEGIAKSEGSFFYLKDALGSNTDIVDGTGTVVQHYAYSAFGKILKVLDKEGNDISASPTVEPYFTYTGREYDSESDLYYYRARFYDPFLGRFLQVDPFQGTLRNPLSHINSYIYVFNNPNKYIDPSGRSGLINFMIGSIKGSWSLAIAPFAAAVNSFKGSDNSGGELWQSTLVAISSFAFTSLGTGLALGANYFFTPIGADLITPFTTGAVAFLQNVTNQAIMSKGQHVNWKRAGKAAVVAGSIQGMANASAWLLGQGTNPFVDGAVAGASLACVDDGTTTMSDQEVDDTVFQLNCGTNF